MSLSARTYSIFKRGMKGVYQHCSEEHLQRYLTEFDFRYSNRAKLGVSDRERADKALKGIEGKRLTYRRISERQTEAAAKRVRRSFRLAAADRLQKNCRYRS